MSRQSITVLGCTGSIGVSALDVIARHPERFEVYALVGHRNTARLTQQALQFFPKFIAITDATAYQAWIASDMKQHLFSCYKSAVGFVPTLLSAPSEVHALCTASEVDTVLAAIVGAAGLQPSLEALKAGKRVLLANKESLVLAGHLMIDAAKSSGAVLLPVDSEHNAIFQSLPQPFLRGQESHGIRSLWLTASGGPFLNTPVDQLQHVTPAQAVAHPNWAMGKKISVDSATMANKGLEVIEAFWLFGLPPDAIQVVIHPQSIIHSLVEYVDGSMLAQLGQPDMRTPIAHTLAYPDRIESGVARLNLTQLSGLTFHQPDVSRFPALRLAYDALRTGGSQAANYNAANEVAVQAFLEKRISFLAIAAIIEHVMEYSEVMALSTIESALEADLAARKMAEQHCRLISYRH